MTSVHRSHKSLFNQSLLASRADDLLRGPVKILIYLYAVIKTTFLILAFPALGMVQGCFAGLAFVFPDSSRGIKWFSYNITDIGIIRHLP